MIFTLIIFFLMLAIAFGMIARRVWQLRTGRFVIQPQYEAADWTELSVEVVRSRLIEWTKFTAHHAILVLLKVWMRTAYGLKHIDRFIHNMLMHLLHKNGHRPIGGKPSNFLKRISDHKSEMPHITATKEEVAEKE